MWRNLTDSCRNVRALSTDISLDLIHLAQVCSITLSIPVYQRLLYTFPAICVVYSAECSAPPLGRGKYSWTRIWGALVVSK